MRVIVMSLPPRIGPAPVISMCRPSGTSRTIELAGMLIEGMVCMAVPRPTASRNTTRPPTLDRALPSRARGPVFRMTTQATVAPGKAGRGHDDEARGGRPAHRRQTVGAGLHPWHDPYPRGYSYGYPASTMLSRRLPRTGRGWHQRRPPLAGAAAEGSLGSGEVLEGRPGLGPGGLQPGHQVDRGALLVVADPEPVGECSDLPHVAELASKEGGIHVHGDRRAVPGRGRAPEPEAVRPAVHLGQPGAPAIAVDRPGLTVIAGQDGGPGAARRDH